MSNLCVGSTLDSRVGRHNCDQVLGINYHICNDIVCLVAAYTLTTH